MSRNDGEIVFTETKEMILSTYERCIRSLNYELVTVTAKLNNQWQYLLCDFNNHLATLALMLFLSSL